MEDGLLKVILRMKEKPIKDLLALTESPIEKRFLLEFLIYLENELSSKDFDHQLDGFIYIMETTDEYGINFSGKVEGLSIINTSYGFTLHVNVSKLNAATGLDFSKKTKTTRSSIKREIPKIELGESRFLYNQRLNFYPQYKVEVDRNSFRLDFAFILREINNQGQTITRKVGVECDGYEFHSTPTQFRKDRERIRKLQEDDWIILQYSGSEINKINFDYKAEFNRIFLHLGFGKKSIRAHK